MIRRANTVPSGKGLAGWAGALWCHGTTLLGCVRAVCVRVLEHAVQWAVGSERAHSPSSELQPLFAPSRCIHPFGSQQGLP